MEDYYRTVVVYVHDHSKYAIVSFKDLIAHLIGVGISSIIASFFIPAPAIMMFFGGYVVSAIVLYFLGVRRCYSVRHGRLLELINIEIVKQSKIAAEMNNDEIHPEH